MTLKYLSVLFFPRWCATLVLRTVSRNRIWTFWKAIRHCRHVFLLPAKDTAVLKLLLIEQKCKPIKWSVLLWHNATIAHDAKLAIKNKDGGFIVRFYEKFLERIFASRASGKWSKQIFSDIAVHIVLYSWKE